MRMLAQLEFRRSIAAAACLFMLANIAKAGPPFVTDDPEPPPAGGWEINIPFIIEHAASGTEMNAPLFDLNYGLPNVQLLFQAPVKIVEQKGDRAVGLSDPLVGIKWRFLSDEKSQVQLGLYPQVLLPLVCCPRNNISYKRAVAASQALLILRNTSVPLARHR